MSRTRLYRHGPGDFRPYLPDRAINPRYGEAPGLILDFQDPVPIPGTDRAWLSRADRRRDMETGGYEEVGSEAPEWLSERQYAQKHGAPREERFGIDKTNPDDPNVSFEWQDFEGLKTGD